MQNLQKRKSLLEKILAIGVLTLICCSIPSLLFWPLCLEQDLDRPPNTEVLISACNRDLRVIGMPDGEALFVGKLHPGNAYLYDGAYLLDLRTREKRNVPKDPLLMQTQGEFLSSELVLLGRYTWGGPPGSENYYHRPDYILDLSDGQRYELIDLNQMPLLEGNQFDPKYYVYFQSAEQVFILQKDNRVIALAPNFRQNPEGNVIYYKNQLNSETNFEDGEVLKQLMKDLGVKYELVDLSYRYADVRSPTGRYILRDDGVYLLGMDRPVVALSSRYSFRSWYYDESAVVIRKPGYHLINLGSAFGSSFEYYYIPGPVLKVPLPAP